MGFPLYLDENVDVLLARILNALGHDVLTARDAGLAQADDPTHFEFAARQGRALITHDIGDYSVLFDEWAAAGRSHSGLLVVRRLSVYEMRDRALALFAAFPDGVANLYLHLSRSY